MIKKTKVSIFFLFCYMIITNYSYANNSIYFIDLDYIYKNSIAGKKINEQIKKESKKINDQLQTFKKEIDNKRTKLVNQKNILSNAEFKKKTDELNISITDYNKLVSNKKNELISLRDKSKIEFSNVLRDILQKYAQDNSIQMILNKSNILIGKNDLDVTKDILDLFNKNIKVIKNQ